MEPNDAGRGEPLHVLLFTTPPKFSPGSFRITPGARVLLSDAEVASALVRHLSGDWGEVDEEDRRENEFSLQMGFRLLSVYHSEKRMTFWLITEADRSGTTILLPEDY
jgi:hypothetical protein